MNKYKYPPVYSFRKENPAKNSGAIGHIATS
jgi:hypothetical protein